MLDINALQLLLAGVLGGIIGLERERLIDEQASGENLTDAVLGVRSFFLMGLFGGVLGLMGKYAIEILQLGIISFLVILFVHYQGQSQRNTSVGMTTAIVTIMTLFMGIFLTFIPLSPKLMIALSVVVAFVLAQKRNLKLLLRKIYGFETNALINFMLLAFVVLPFVPNFSLKLNNLPYLYIFFENVSGIWQKIALIEVLNPAKIWNLLVLVVGIDFLGYLLKRTLGRKHGVLLQAAAGGIASSTATTVGLAHESVHPHSNPQSLIGPTILANTVSILPLIALIVAFNGLFFQAIYPYLFLLILIGFLLTLIFLHKKNIDQTEILDTLPSGEIFSLIPAFKFLAIFVGVKIMLQIFGILFGTNGVIVGIILGALTGMDAVTVSIAEIAGKQISYSSATMMFLIANTVNLLGFKSMYIWTKGNRVYAKKTIFNLAIIAFSSLGIFFLS